jgi:hypothetical protein
MYAFERELFYSNIDHDDKQTSTKKKKRKVNSMDQDSQQDEGFHENNEIQLNHDAIKNDDSSHSSDTTVKSTEESSVDNNIREDYSDFSDDMDLLQTQTEQMQLNLQENIAWNCSEDYENFNIKSMIIQKLVTKYTNKRENVLFDNPLFNGSEVTYREFVKRYRCIISDGNITNKLTQELNKLIISAQPQDSLVHKYGLDPHKNSNFEESFTDTCTTFEFNCCICGYIIYEGNNSYLQDCKYCSLSRFTDKNKRYPIATLTYRPITTIICELLETDNFLTAINLKSNDSNKAGIYVDITDGEYSKELMADMNAKHKLKVDRNDIDESTIEVSLLLGFGYDGAQIFHYSTSNFWPMLISILNLPPALRKTMGVGTFMISLFTSVEGSNCEEFLLHKCLVEELKMLDDGVVVEINGTKYHIQARLCIFLLDSKAVESVTKTQGANSKVGCPFCRFCPG